MAGLNKNVFLITGGTGFIGSHIADRLSKLGAKVIIVDYQIDPNSYYIVNKVYTKTIFELVDIRNKELVEEIIKKYSPDYILHLAADPIVEKAYENPYSTFEINIMGTVNVLEAARKSGKIKGILVTSSDKAYGKTDSAYTEESPLRGDHPYDVSKSAQDLISQTYYKTYGLPIIITRFGNVYGEGDVHINRIIPGICEAVIKNKVFDVRSNGKYVRDYLYIEDVVEGCLLLLSNFQDVTGECFNFSSTETMPVLAVVKSAEKILKTKIPVKILNIAKNEIPYQHLDDKKIRKLGWKNNHTFLNTLPGIVSWYENVLK